LHTPLSARAKVASADATKTNRKADTMKKAAKKIRFKLVIEAQEMVVDYQPNRLKDLGLFEFRSPHKPARRILVSETGYRSHFADMKEVTAAASPKEYARQVVLEMMRVKVKGAVAQATDSRQLALFG
jgi:hypothetical protein